MSKAKIFCIDWFSKVTLKNIKNIRISLIMKYVDGSEVRLQAEKIKDLKSNMRDKI